MDWLEPLRKDTERMRQENIEMRKETDRMRKETEKLRELGNKKLKEIVEKSTIQHKELKEPINYFDEIIIEYNRLKDIERKYRELLYQIRNVFPNETLHETALRYIKNAEDSDSNLPELFQ